MGQPPVRTEVTGFLKAWSSGRPEALDKLMPVVQDELRRLAASYMRRERRDHTLQVTGLVNEAYLRLDTLQVTGLVNEAYLRLVEQKEVSWQDRRHFFGIAAQCMRRVLVDYARHRHADKRAGGKTFVVLDDSIEVAEKRGIDLIALDDALASLAELDERQAQVVELRFFGGLTILETARLLKISTATVKRDWESARVWLTCELTRR
jgi:RNA polymerase sigma factor (TIGR02999 family)